MPDASHLAAIDTVLAIVLTFVLGARVGALRGKYKIDAPAMTGHPAFERACRTHLNTVENLVLMLPVLWLATTFYGTTIPFWLGLGWVIARVVYAIGYAQTNTQLRGPGMGLSFLCVLGLLVLSVMGIAR